MARFEVYRLADGGIVLDCQSNLLDDIGTRFVVPLVPDGATPPHNPHLNPNFRISDQDLTMVTQFATTIRTKELRSRIGSLADEHERIIRAVDVLLGVG